MARLDSSGIRKVFDMAAKMASPVNLSIGQPDFDVPEPIRRACHRGYRPAQKRLFAHPGDLKLVEKLQARVMPNTAKRIAEHSSPAAPAAGSCWP